MTDVADLDDEALLHAHVEGDADAFGELVRRHRDRLWAVALRTTGDPEDAADAVQEALISAFRRAQSFRGDAQVTTWLHRIVVNACLDRMRARSSRPTERLPQEDHDAALRDHSARGDLSQETSDRRADVMAALRLISPEQRAALVLVDMEGYSVEAAAEILQCAPGTVKSRCSRGRARLVPLLATYRRNRDPGSDVETSTAGAPARPLSSSSAPDQGSFP